MAESTNLELDGARASRSTRAEGQELDINKVDRIGRQAGTDGRLDGAMTGNMCDR